MLGKLIPWVIGLVMAAVIGNVLGNPYAVPELGFRLAAGGLTCLLLGILVSREPWWARTVFAGSIIIFAFTGDSDYDLILGSQGVMILGALFWFTQKLPDNVGSSWNIPK